MAEFPGNPMKLGVPLTGDCENVLPSHAWSDAVERLARVRGGVVRAHVKDLECAAVQDARLLVEDALKRTSVRNTSVRVVQLSHCVKSFSGHYAL